ncbi:MAG: TIR domain-containing protein [Candidatus Omnitrophica bacterium]|nr:TIR domain-containing protein [Candidatus Omnitrophota bacterium]
MSKKKVFVSFDYDNDKHYKYLLEAWDANSDFSFTFADKTSHEINSDNVGRVKAALTQKIKDADYTLAIIGKYANDEHEDSELIGEINWINWEIKKSSDIGNKLVGVKIDKSYESPEAIVGVGASWAMSFTEEAIINALDNA